MRVWLSDGWAAPGHAVVVRDEARIRLSSREADLLTMLARHPGQVVSREDLGAAWGPGGTNRRALDVAIFRLRQKLEPDPSSPTHLQTVHGEGYRLVPAEPREAPDPGPLPAPRGPLIGRDQALAALEQAASFAQN